MKVELVAFGVCTESLSDDRAFKTSIISKSCKHVTNWDFLFIGGDKVLLVRLLESPFRVLFAQYNIVIVFEQIGIAICR